MEKQLTPTNYEVIPIQEATHVRFYTSIHPGSYVPPHWHDAVEIVYLQKSFLFENGRIATTFRLLRVIWSKCLNSMDAQITFFQDCLMDCLVELRSTYYDAQGHYVKAASIPCNQWFREHSA